MSFLNSKLSPTRCAMTGITQEYFLFIGLNSLIRYTCQLVCIVFVQPTISIYIIYLCSGYCWLHLINRLLSPQTHISSLLEWLCLLNSVCINILQLCPFIFNIQTVHVCQLLVASWLIFKLYRWLGHYFHITWNANEQSHLPCFD
jgi:hypothetical protein